MLGRGAEDLSEEAYDSLARSGCFVCALVEGRPFRPDPQVIFEDQAVIAFLNDFPTQDGYTLVCPKRHAERLEHDFSPAEWAHLQLVVRRVARAVADATGAMRMYIAALGSPERNAHVHIHVCPCPAGTRFDLQQFVAMRHPDGIHRAADPERQLEIARHIRQRLRTTADAVEAGPRLILVAGAPGSGKTTLAKRLASELGIPLLTKDEIKVTLAGSLGAEGLDRSRRLGAAAVAVLYRAAGAILAGGSGLVLESAFSRGLEAELAPLLSAGSARLIRCRVPPELTLKRYGARQRHWVHFDGERLDDLGARVAAGHYDIDLDVPTLDVDTADGYKPSLEAVAAFVRHMDGSPGPSKSGMGAGPFAIQKS